MSQFLSNGYISMTSFRQMLLRKRFFLQFYICPYHSLSQEYNQASYESSEWMNEWMNKRYFTPQFCTVRLYWAWKNRDEWDERLGLNQNPCTTYPDVIKYQAYHTIQYNTIQWSVSMYVGHIREVVQWLCGVLCMWHVNITACALGMQWPSKTGGTYTA